MKDVEISKNKMVVQINGIPATVYGGSYLNYEHGIRRLKGVKMAIEIDKPCDISIPTKDFSVPTQAIMTEGVLCAVMSIMDGNDLYVGCMGGTGRTGLFMACLVKALNDYQDTHDSSFFPVNPVSYVRANYKAHAVETVEQQEFVASFKTTPIVQAISNRVNGKEQVMIVHQLVYPRWFDYIMFKLFGTI